MKVGIMQPYFFPYIGYFQLIASVDKFVVHDDVQYIKAGWINRNKILLNGKEYLFVFSVKKDSFDRDINQRFFSDRFDFQKAKFLRVLKQAYIKAAYFKQVYSLVNEIFSYDDLNVSNLNVFGIKKISRYLGIKTPIVLSSKLKKNNSLKGEERVININKTLGATRYINPVGGVDLYSKKYFLENGIKLLFLKPLDIKYKQLDNAFLSWLSIIDICMFNKKEDIQTFLNQYELKY